MLTVQARNGINLAVTCNCIGLYPIIYRDAVVYDVTEDKFLLCTMFKWTEKVLNFKTLPKKIKTAFT